VDDAATEAPTTPRPIAGIAATTLAVTVWGSMSVLVKSVDGLDGAGISFYRLLLGSFLLTGMLRVTGGRLSRSLLVACIPGGAAFAVDIVFYFSALRETSVANATIIGALQPILLLPIGIRWFGERLDARMVLYSVLALAGTTMVVFGNAAAPEVSPAGDLMAVGALLAWTAYFVISKQASARFGAIEYFAGLTVVATVMMAPLLVVLDADLVSSDADDWISIVALTVFSGALGHVLLNWSHEHVPLQVMSLLTLLVPVVATVGAVVVLDEEVVAIQWGGMAVVVGALAEVVRRSTRRPDPAIVEGVPAV
jgi:drug/metabolite transporter (DMT)-like permease